MLPDDCLIDGLSQVVISSAKSPKLTRTSADYLGEYRVDRL